MATNARLIPTEHEPRFAPRGELFEVFGDEIFDHDYVVPAAIQEGVLLVHAHFPPTGPVALRTAGVVVRHEYTDQFEVPLGAPFGLDRPYELLAHAVAAVVAVDVEEQFRIIADKLALRCEANKLGARVECCGFFPLKRAE